MLAAVLAAVLAAHPASAETRVRLLSYNMAGIPLVQRLAGDRISELGRHLQNYDVVGLQEVWNELNYQSLREIAGFPNSLRRYDFPVGNGLVLLSRFPVVEWRFYPFTGRAAPHLLFANGDGDSICTKGAIAARLRTPDGELDVYATHVIAEDSPVEDAEIRVSQLLELDDAVRDFSQGRPFVVLGDFNVTPASSQLRMLLSLLGTSDACMKSGKDMCGPTWKSGARIDYVLGPAENASRAFDRPFIVRGAPMLLSDHLGGIQAELRLPLPKKLAQASNAGRKDALRLGRDALRAAVARLKAETSRWAPLRWYFSWWSGVESAPFEKRLAKLDAELVQ
jgi:endonuclease/exonuclease/phosphatase family metal-dependent hydrolase